MSKISRNGTQDYLFTYDVWDRTTSISVGDTTLATYTYEDGNGNLLTQTYGNGDAVSYTYDDLGRIETVTYTSAAGTVTRVLTNTYNGNGQLYSVHDSATGQTMRYTYDSLGRLISASNEDTHENFTFNTCNQLTPSGFPREFLCLI